MLLRILLPVLLWIPLLASAQQNLTDAYREPAGQILGAAMVDAEGWEKLEYLTIEIGHRLSGSTGLERAIDWAAERMQEEGLLVRKLPVAVPHWVRGFESAQLLAPVERPLSILGLGGSVGTPEAGITAPVIAVTSFENLEQLERIDVEGKIVLYAVPWMGYEKTVKYRAGGASRAAELGAVAVLIRSVTGRSLNTPHTGGLRYDENLPKIPAAAVTVEDAEWMRRRIANGHEVRVRLEMGAQVLADADSFNLVAEIPGSESPDEVVVMGGHYDSWDVGQGAHDDGAACMAAWQALTIIRHLGLRPRRTLRVVLWTNEENGLRGAQAYRDWVGDDIDSHVAAIEMDGGAERPIGFTLGIGFGDEEASAAIYEKALATLTEIGALLDGINAGLMKRGGGGADISPLMREGVPGMGLETVGEHYFDWHHSEADTLDKVDPQDFRKAVAALGVIGYVLADMPGTLPRGNLRPGTE